MERIQITKINDHILLLNDNNEATGYLVVGSKKALIIDTMLGYVDVHAVARTLTEHDVRYEWFGGICMAHPYGPRYR